MADDANETTQQPAMDAETGVALEGDYPHNHRLRAEALVADGKSEDPGGIISKELIAETAERLERQRITDEAAEAERVAAEEAAKEAESETAEQRAEREATEAAQKRLAAAQAAFDAGDVPEDLIDAEKAEDAVDKLIGKDDLIGIATAEKADFKSTWSKGEIAVAIMAGRNS